MKHLIIICSILFISFPVKSAERYDDIKKKIANSNASVFVDGFREIIMAYDLESGFVKDCLASVKLTKKLPTKECSRVYDRGKGLTNLSSIISSSNFKNNLLKVASNIDANKGNITKKDIEKLTQDFDKSFNDFNSLTKELNFVLANL